MVAPPHRSPAKLHALSIAWGAAFVVLLAAGCDRAPNTADVEVLRAHVARYPLAGIEDLYSVALHGMKGSAHGGVDSAGAAAGLARELERLPAGPLEPLAEPLRGDTALVRLNLRPYVAAGGEADALLRAFLETGRTFRGSGRDLTRLLGAFEHLAVETVITVSPDSARRFAEAMIAADYPIREHSVAYLAAYRTAYRVVGRAQLASLVRDIGFEDDPFATSAPPLPLGRFGDDYGGTHVVSPTTWQQGNSARYSIVAWQPAERYLIAQNDSLNPSAPGRWTRIDWVPLDGMMPWTWAFCFAAYDAPSADSAEATRVARAATPRTGCNGFPYSRLRPDTIPVHSGIGLPTPGSGIER
jgi:hypothetical protein